MGYVCSKSNNNDKISKSEEYYNVTEELNLFTDSSTKNQIVEIFCELKNIDDKFNGKYSINLQISDHNQFNINNENKLSSFINLGSTDEIFPIEGEINFEKPFKIPYYLSIRNLSLGAEHDQTGRATACPASSNYIMTSSIGSYSNSSNLFYFSPCSVSSFKRTVLTADKKLLYII